MGKKQMQKYVGDTDADLASRIHREFSTMYGVPRTYSTEQLVAAQNRTVPLMQELTRRFKAEAKRSA